MKQDNKNRVLTVGLIVSIISFLVLYVGVKVVLSNEIIMTNIIAYIILSLILGGITSILYYFKLNIAVMLFSLGIVIGSFEMYRKFIDGMDGWGDLAGLMSFLAWIIIGLSSGLVVQLIVHLYKKMKLNNKE